MDGFNKISIVNPTKYKFNQTVLNQNYYQMLRILSQELERKESILIVFGFSFADEHITEIVRRSLLNPTLQVFIICFNEKSKEDIYKKIEENSNVVYMPKFEKNECGTSINGNIIYLNNLLKGILQ